MNRFKTGLVMALLSCLGIGFAAAQDAAALTTSMTTGLGGVSTNLWTIGGVVAGIVAVVVTIGALLRNGRRMGSAA